MTTDRTPPQEAAPAPSGITAAQPPQPDRSGAPCGAGAAQTAGCAPTPKADRCACGSRAYTTIICAATTGHRPWSADWCICGCSTLAVLRCHHTGATLTADDGGKVNRNGDITGAVITHNRLTAAICHECWAAAAYRPAVITRNWPPPTSTITTPTDTDRRRPTADRQPVLPGIDQQPTDTEGGRNK